MVEYIICFALAFIVAFSATPVAKKLSFKVGAVDIPKDGRRMHKKPIARLGGVAIVSGFLITILFYVIGYFVDREGFFTPDKQLLGLIGGSAIIVALGIVDDIKSLDAKIKLVFQVLAAMVVVLSGTRIVNFTNPFSPEGISFLSDYISYPLTVFWIVGITNAINLIDGLDGLAAGVSSIASLSLFFVSLITGDFDTAFITAALAGSSLGFLPYNFNPAKIFMGDTGATFLGFTLGVISIQGMIKSYAALAIAIPILVLGLPLFDTLFAIIRRVVKRKPIMQADRGHLHHKLMDMGLSQKQSVGVMYVTSSVLGLCAIVLADKGALSAIILIIAVSAFVIAGTRYMNEMNSDEYQAGGGEEEGRPEGEAKTELPDGQDNGKESEGKEFKDGKDSKMVTGDIKPETQH
ncbi:MAG: MraY family glycosyltransferase [Clostridiales bacterium]|nr:undecaprenyl/decaprenyl-phosphate alpha-N-acetylglucosaminyl 1-phosphate transferase [Eubacteriales bacterium]MDH7566317.1 MraY family glycosyltransferase [Clostridiales bacterium]